MSAHKGIERHVPRPRQHHEKAAKHHREAAKHHEAGDHEKAAHHAHIAHGHATTPSTITSGRVVITRKKHG